MDWNHDGKHDWKDDAFFYNIVIKDSDTETNNKNCNHTASGSSNSTGNGLVWFIVFCVVYFIIKLIA